MDWSENNNERPVCVVVSSLLPNLQQARKCKEHQVLCNNHLKVQDSDVFLGKPVGKLSNHLTAIKPRYNLQ